MRRAAALGCSAGWLPLLLPVLASGFVLTGLGNTSGTPPSDLPGNSHRWNVPASSTSDEGLGGGLSWVLEAGFCDRMRPRFPERQILGGVDIPGLDFVSCEDVHDALLRAFATWSANHKLITFTDLAQASRCESQFVTGELSDSCPWELYIGTDDGVAYPRLAAYVLNYRSSSVDSQWFQGSVRSSAGTLDYGVDAHARSVMRMQTHLCWYLDATFCYMFQEASDNDNVDVRAPTPGTPPPVRAPPADRAPPRPLQMQLIVRVACFFLLGLAITRLLTIVFWCYLAISCTRGTARRGDQQHGSIGGVAIRSRKGCSPGVSACLDYLASLSPLVNLGALFCLIFPPIFYERIFLPCWECYDFEAAVAHEVGHVLGFGHPDDIPEINLVAPFIGEREVGELGEVGVHARGRRRLGRTEPGVGRRGGRRVSTRRLFGEEEAIDQLRKGAVKRAAPAVEPEDRGARAHARGLIAQQPLKLGLGGHRLAPRREAREQREHDYAERPGVRSARVVRHLVAGEDLGRLVGRGARGIAARRVERHGEAPVGDHERVQVGGHQEDVLQLEVVVGDVAGVGMRNAGAQLGAQRPRPGLGEPGRDSAAHPRVHQSIKQLAASPSSIKIQWSEAPSATPMYRAIES